MKDGMRWCVFSSERGTEHGKSMAEGETKTAHDGMIYLLHFLYLLRRMAQGSALGSRWILGKQGLWGMENRSLGFLIDLTFGS
jgi:hypothetical protein